MPILHETLVSEGEKGEPVKLTRGGSDSVAYRTGALNRAHYSTES